MVVPAGRARELHSRKVFDFLADDADAALVGGVELEDAGGEEGGAVEGAREGEDGGGFAGAGRAVVEHVGELEGRLVGALAKREGVGAGKTNVGGLKGALEDGDGVVLSCHIGETLWAAEG